MIAELLLIVRLAIRNLLSSATNIIIGMLILVGTFLVMTTNAVLRSVDYAMSRSVAGSVAGDAQVYSAASEDELTLWGAPDNVPRLEPLRDFPRLRQALEAVPNVKSVVPMGGIVATISSGNELDRVLGDLRQALTAHGPVEPLKAQVRQMISALNDEISRANEMADTQSYEPGQLEALAQTSTPAFWEHFDQAPFDSLELLENRVAPLMADPQPAFIRFVGTDLDAFQGAFDRMRIVEGRRVPAGHRGVLLSRQFYEETLKLKVARRFDRIHETLGKGETIAASSELQRLVEENQANTREILFQLDEPRTRELTQRLSRELGGSRGALPELLRDFLRVDDSNAEARYRFFYEQVVPLLRLYRVQVGDVFNLKSLTRAGSMAAVPVRLYGVFEFTGLEKAALAGTNSLMDLMSFRDLQGELSEDGKKDLEALRATGSSDGLTAENAEATLFGGESTDVVAEGQERAIDVPEKVVTEGIHAEELLARTYSREEMEQGIFLNAAVVLKDPSLLEDTMARVSEAARGQGFSLKVVSWREAAGVLGNIVTVIRGVLYFAASLIFLVTLLILNNAMVMATLRRRQEVGTMRAMGAQRGFILAMVLCETGILGVGFGLVGAALSGGLVGWLGKVGIPAANEYVTFFFAGPRLFPSVSVGHAVGALTVVIALSLISTLYPALLAARVSPLEAMQTED